MNSLLQRRFEKFKSNRKAWFSLWILILTYGTSLLAPVLANNQPWIVSYNGHWKSPVFFFYTDSDFGGTELSSPNYKRLAKKENFTNGPDWILFPPVSYGFNEDNLETMEKDENPPSPPSWKHWMGTDDRGRDVFTRIFYAYRNSMSFGLILVLIEFLFGTIVGGIQGYYGKRTDIIIQRFVEILSAIPFLYLILIMGSFFGRGFIVLGITYSALSWIGISAYMRGEFYRAKTLTYVDAARALGVSSWKIMKDHILPNAITPLVTFLPFTLIGAISILSALDFLGYGIPAPNPSWGEMISQGRENIRAWWLITFPSFALANTILLTSFVGEGIRDSFDSKEKVVYE